MSWATHCWQVDGAWRVGREVLACSESRRGDVLLQSIAVSEFQLETLLMQNYHRPEVIEAVPVAWLRPYPTQEIPTP
jgi:hypothetical protein